MGIPTLDDNVCGAKRQSTEITAQKKHRIEAPDGIQGRGATAVLTPAGVRSKLHAEPMLISARIKDRD